jgi:hypothetical protein
MEDTLTCPICEMETAYFDGIVFTCPDCGYEWSHDLDIKPKSGDIEDYTEFSELATLTIPFFKLEHGRLYECTVKHKMGLESLSIIPLAFKPGKNLQFIMTNARRLVSMNPGYVREIIQMDYDYIYNDGLRDDYPDDYDAMTTICATRDDITLLDSEDFEYFDFKITDEI